MSTDLGVDLIWGNDETWDFLNFNSSGDLVEDGGGGGADDEKSGEKLPDSTTPSSENQPAAGTEMMAPPPPPPEGSQKNEEESKKKKGKGIIKNEEGGEGKKEASEHDRVHIFTERERRKRMRTMFTNLHALLPQLPVKADKSTIVDEAIKSIKSLEITLHKLEKHKQERLQGINNIPIINYNVCLPKIISTESTREAFVANQVSANPNIAAAAFNPTPTDPLASQFTPSFQTWCSKNLMLNVSGLDAQICVCSNKRPGLFTGICFVLDKYKLEIVSAHVSSDNFKIMYMIHTHACCVDLLETIPVEEIYKQAVREVSYYYNLE